jgi:hypothetical protein
MALEAVVPLRVSESAPTQGDALGTCLATPRSFLPILRASGPGTHLSLRASGPGALTQKLREEK